GLGVSELAARCPPDHRRHRRAPVRHRSSADRNRGDRRPGRGGAGYHRGPKGGRERVSGPAFEATFRSWCEAASVDWTVVRYTRPEAGGETRAHRLRPRGEVRGGVLVVHGAGNDALFSLTGVFAALLRT